MRRMPSLINCFINRSNIKVGREFFFSFFLFFFFLSAGEGRRMDDLVRNIEHDVN